VEYSPWDGVPGAQPPFAVPEMFHLWALAPTALNTGCFLDETCYDGYSWVGSFSKGVAYLVFPDGTCSGTLINDRNNTGTPYLMTAGHCAVTSDDARAMLAVFGFKTSSCNGTPNYYGTYPQVSGATLLARDNSAVKDRPDFAFVQLPRYPAITYAAIGWAFTPTSADRLTSVGHPRNLSQRLAVGNISSSSDANYYTIHIYQGAIDHGSSGSGLINDDVRLVAVSSYSSNAETVSSCDITDRDYGYTKFSAIYPLIQQWLEAPVATHPLAILLPVNLNLGSQAVGTASATQSSALSNTGTGPLAISSIVIQGSNATEFSQTSNCGTTLAAGAACTITFTFRPVSAGSKFATAVITDNALGSPHSVTLTGTGIAAVVTPVIGNQVTTDTNVLATGGCRTPALVTSFPITASAVWLYFDADGVGLNDVFHIFWYKPDGTVSSSVDTTPGLAGGVCFSYHLSVAGSPPAASPGNWSVKVFWNQQTTPLITRSFTIGTTVTPSQPGALQLVTVAPCRVMDTRDPNGLFGGPFIGAGASRTIPIPSSSCGVPSVAKAYSLNFTIVPRGRSLSSLTVWPSGQPRPLVSTLTSPDASVIANAAIVPAGVAGSIDAFSSDETDLIVDINGYFVPPAPGTLQFFPLPPCRALDTRNPNGTFGGPSLAGGSSRSFPIPTSGCGAPASAAAYSLNLTLVPHGPLGYLTTWPTGQAQPFVSTMNSWDGTVLANAAVVPAGAGGAVSFFASNTTDVIVDINGYFAAPRAPGLNFYTVNPCRAVDTRNANGAFGGPVVAGSETRNFPLSQSACGLPGYPTAQAYSLSITVVPQGVLGYLSTWPAGATQPLVSTLNAWKAIAVANAALVPASTGGAISVFVTNPTQVIIDTAGYFGP
jgi:hypothetical protein